MADTLGQHLVEAHWKYFTIKVRDQYECDKASHLHYEFLLNRYDSGLRKCYKDLSDYHNHVRILSGAVHCENS